MPARLHRQATDVFAVPPVTVVVPASRYRGGQIYSSEIGRLGWSRLVGRSVWVRGVSPHIVDHRSIPRLAALDEFARALA